jgi:chemotaxis protein CheC
MIELHELEQDALTEIFNIGVGVAADALYQMVGEQVPLSVPVVELTSHHRARKRHMAGGAGSVYAIRQTYIGEFSTDAILMFSQESSEALVRMMVGKDMPQEQLAEVAADALAELGNIILNAVMSELASSLSIRLEGSLPEVNVVDPEDVFVTAVGHGDAAGAADSAAPVLALMIDFELSAQRAQGYLAFLLDTESTEELVSRLASYVKAS